MGMGNEDMPLYGAEACWQLRLHPRHRLRRSRHQRLSQPARPRREHHSGRQVDSNRPNLPTRDREIGRVLVQAEGLAPAAFPCLRDVAGDARHRGVVELADADLVVRRQQIEGGADAR